MLSRLRRIALVLSWCLLPGSGCATSGESAPANEPAASPSAPAAPAAAGGSAETDSDVPLPERPELAWWRDSMKDRDARLGWFRQARFGMFVHWGVYSALGGVWEGQPVTGYAEHIQRIRKIPIPVYRQKVAGIFNPTAFDADAWIAAAKRAGMGYFIITAKHHDGFAMYDSAVSDYNVVKATPWKRDPMKDLKAACAKHGLKFGFYYSHAFDWGEENGAGNDWDYENPGGDRNLHGGRDWWKSTPGLRPKIRKYVDSKAIPQLEELIAKYDPDILWFDTPHKLPPDENLRILRAVRKAKPSIVVNGRIVQVVPGGPKARFGDYASTADRPAEVPPHDGDWEAIPTTNESYGWHQKDASHKPASHFIQLLAKAAARGGNVLLNVGPMGEGRIDPKDQTILDGLAAWMKHSRDSISGTERTPLPVQAWGESTRKGNVLYLHVLRWPTKRLLLLGGLKSPVKTAHFLKDPRRRPLNVTRMGELDLAIALPAKPIDAADSVIVLTLDGGGEPQADPARLLSTEVGLDELRAFDAKIDDGLAFGAGKVRDAWVHHWTKPELTVRWPVRLAERASFSVSIAYDAPASSAGGTFEVLFGDKKLAGTIVETPAAPVPLGRVTLEPGVFEITVRGTALKGEELMRLRSLRLTPVSVIGS